MVISTICKKDFKIRYVQEDLLGTKVKRYNGTSNVHLYSSDLHLDLVPQGWSWSRHQNCKRMGWYKSYQHEFISITCLSTGATRDPGHGTRIARGFVRYKGEKVLYLYSLFSSLLLSWSVLELHMCIVVFGVLLVVLCFDIEHLLSRVRSLGRCF